MVRIVAQAYTAVCALRIVRITTTKRGTRAHLVAPTRQVERDLCVLARVHYVT